MHRDFVFPLTSFPTENIDKPAVQIHNKRETSARELLLMSSSTTKTANGCLDRHLSNWVFKQDNYIRGLETGWEQ